MNKVLILLTVFCPLQQNVLNAQNLSYTIKDSSIQLTNKTVVVPQIYVVRGNDTANLKAVNDKIIDEFNVIPDAPKDELDYDNFVDNLEFFKDSGGFLDTKCSHKIKSGFVEINIEGNYVKFEGKPMFEIYQTYQKKTFYVDIEKNEVFNSSGYDNEIKLKYFFEPKEYLELLSKTWIPKIQRVKERYPDDIEYEYTCEDCSSSSVYLQPFSFEYKLENDSLFFFLESVTYFKNFCFQDFCSPKLEVSYPIEDVDSLFKNDFDWLEYNRLDKISKVILYKEKLENNSNKSKLISGRIDGKYPFLMTLRTGNEKEIKGHYMYTSNQKFLALKGRAINNKSLEIFEYLNDKSTGKFELKYKDTLSSEYDIKRFKWHSSDGKKSYDVEVDSFEIY